MGDLMLRKFALMGLIVFATAGTASAAKLSLTASPDHTYDWTGCYVGAHGGGAWSQLDWTPVGVNDFGSYRANGWAAGGQFGCDYQNGGFVFGLEGQFSAAGIDGQVLSIGTQAVTKSHIDEIATGTGRIGYAFDRILPYIKGGFAWVHDKHKVVTTTGSMEAGGGVFGWTVGGGIEVAFRPNWSWMIEFNHIDLGTNAFTFDQSGASIPLEIKQTVDDVLIGINYRFE